MKNDLETFISMAQEILQEEQAKPVAKFIESSQLFNELDLTLSDKPVTEEQLYNALKRIVLHTPHTGSKAFFNQLFGGRKGKAVLGDLLAVMLNNSMYTYKVGGPQIGVEQEVINKVIELIGYPEGSGGTFAPGGSMSNMMAMIMARDYFNNDITQQGVAGAMVCYASAESHYSIPKNASFIGIGRQQVRLVDTDEQGRMKPEHLRDLIAADLQNGLSPFLVISTAGTTVMGAFDPIDEIGEVAREHKLWHHVDGAFGGSLIFSERYRAMLQGLAQADSFCLNAHKMLGTPLFQAVQGIVFKVAQQLIGSTYPHIGTQLLYP